MPSRSEPKSEPLMGDSSLEMPAMGHTKNSSKSSVPSGIPGLGGIWGRFAQFGFAGLAASLLVAVMIWSRSDTNERTRSTFAGDAPPDTP